LQILDIVLAPEEDGHALVDIGRDDIQDLRRASVLVGDEQS
jgi:hypothetical protein